ncbi:MAG: GTPase, partial [Hyphomonadaceae bacterium]
MSDAQRCAVIAVLGAPNAGKSTLVNSLVGAKVAAVTQKVQTTRALVRGVAMRGQTQLVLIDTPGVFAPKRRLDRAMVAAAWSAIEGADMIVHLVDAAAHAPGASKPGEQRAVEDAARLAEKLKQMETPALLVLNKVDAIARPELLAITAKLVEQGLYTDVFMVSALKGDGVEDLAKTLV